MVAKMTESGISLLYDGECPFCASYSRRLRLLASAGSLHLVSAREDSELLCEVSALGLDMDGGMVVKLAGKIYYGADALHILALLSSRSGLFNRLNYCLFKSPKLAAIGYPLLRYLRMLALKIMAKPKINNLHVSDNRRC